MVCATYEEGKRQGNKKGVNMRINIHIYGTKISEISESNLLHHLKLIHQRPMHRDSCLFQAPTVPKYIWSYRTNKQQIFYEDVI